MRKNPNQQTFDAPNTKQGQFLLPSKRMPFPPPVATASRVEEFFPRLFPCVTSQFFFSESKNDTGKIHILRRQRRHLFDNFPKSLNTAIKPERRIIIPQSTPLQNTLNHNLARLPPIKIRKVILPQQRRGNRTRLFALPIIIKYRHSNSLFNLSYKDNTFPQHHQPYPLKNSQQSPQNLQVHFINIHQASKRAIKGR